MRKQTRLIFEMGAEGRRGYIFPALDVPAQPLDDIVGEENLRTAPPMLPSAAEIEVVRHFTALADLNFGVDTGFYPLGSCTMKYNPKINEAVTALPGFADAHPCLPDKDAQGSLTVLHDMEKYLCAICGMDAFTLQPAAGAHGELTGLMLIAAYHQKRGDSARKVVLIPDSAHGTNPASAALAGFTVRTVPSGSDGLVDIPALKVAAEETGAELAGLMLTNPNTLGLFERDILVIADIVHGKGGLLYYDGANLNAIMGHTSPGAMGFDVVHVNLHKTFATPHGGGGPGAGPVGVVKALEPFLPVPRISSSPQGLVTSSNYPDTIGRIRSFYGNFGVVLKAYCYILSNGADGLKTVSETAVLNARYIKNALKDVYEIPVEGDCLHEFVLSVAKMKDNDGVSALDVAKALIDRGFHPPTIYFPLIVREGMMIEPTETETVQTLDEFIAAMKDIVTAVKHNPQELRNAPINSPIARPDDVRAVRQPILKYNTNI